MKSSVKRVLFTLASLIAVFLLFTVTAYAEDYGNFYYSNVSPEEGQDFDEYNEITGYKSSDDATDTVVNIPSEIEDVPVTRIAASAFYGNKVITDVIIPDSVTTISNAAFYNCSALKVIVIPDSVTYIGESAFQGCTALEYVIMGNGVKTIGDVAFKGCSALKSLELGSAVETIGSGAFFDCDSLTAVYVPDSVKTIGSLAFGLVQNGDAETPVAGFSFYANNNDEVKAYAAGFTAGESDETENSVLFTVTENVTPCSDDAHSVNFVNVRKATDAYEGLDVAQCAACKKLVTRANTEIAAKDDGNSAMTTLIIVLVILVVLVVFIAIYVRKSKARRAASIAAYKEGKTMPGADEKEKEEAKKKEKEAKKREKQLAKLKGYGIIKDDE